MKKILIQKSAVLGFLLCALMLASMETSAQQPPPTSTPIPQTPTPDLDRRVFQLEVQYDQTMKSLQTTNTFTQIAMGMAAGLVALLVAIQGISTYRQWRREDKSDERQQESDSAARIMSGLQKENFEQVNTITTAIAQGAAANVKSLNEILGSFQSILDFKVKDAQKAEILEQQVKKMREQIDLITQQQENQIDELLKTAVKLRRSRFLYTSPDPDLQRQMVEFRTQMDLIPRTALERYISEKPASDRRFYGEIYLRRGIIAYYDNDVFKSREMLTIAEQFLPFSEQECMSMPLDQKLPIAFTQFYLALIEKNYGNMARARDHIERSYKMYGQNEPAELLTPVTRAEIFSYLNDTPNALLAIQEVLDRAARLPKPLRPHDATYAVRARLYLGNTHYAGGSWREALKSYGATLKTDEKHIYSYYAYHSIAQVYHRLGDETRANKNRGLAHRKLLETGHLKTKVALDTRILLNALAYLCTHGVNAAKAAEYRETVRELWLQIREVGDLQLRLFSFESKKPVSKEEFWTEVFKDVS